MTVLTVIILVVLAAVAIYAVAVKGDYFVSKSASMAVPREKVFGAVADLRRWPDWSPWLMHERECELAYSESPGPEEEGGGYEWKGKKVGEGKMTHLSLKAPELIVQRLDFVKPFKSVCEVTWSFEEEGDGTKVTWTMAGSMPFLFRLFAGSAKRMIAKDYELGLSMLRREVDPSSPTFSFEFPGVSEFPALRGAFVTYKGDMDGLKAKLDEIFPKLKEAANDGSGNTPGRPMGVCVKMDEKSGLIEYEAFVPTSNDSCGEFQVKEYPAMICNKVQLRGSYDMLPLARYVAFANTAMNKLKIDKKKAPFEVYENDPADPVSHDDLLTSIHIPVKS